MTERQALSRPTYEIAYYPLDIHRSQGSRLPGETGNTVLTPQPHLEATCETGKHPSFKDAPPLFNAGEGVG